MRSSAATADTTPVNGQTPAPDASRILMSVGEAAYEWDLVTDAMRWTGNVQDVLGLEASEVCTGRALAGYVEPSAVRADALDGAAGTDTGAGIPFHIEYRLRPDPQNAERQPWIEEVGRWFAGSDGRPRRAHGVVRLTTDRRTREERLAWLAGYDETTGQMNRSRFSETLASTLDGAMRARTSFGLLLAGIENLGHINEAYGFAVADEVIGAVARRLRGSMRGGDALGRWSGNKFALMLASCSVEDLPIAAERFLASVRDDVVRTSAGSIAIVMSMGGVVAPRHARTVHELVARAQEALDQAKAKRRGTFVGYRPSLEREASRRENLRTTDALLGALDEQRVALAFQPIARVTDRRTAFWECLVRIRRPDGSEVPAGAIVPIAEKLGLVRALDKRVAELAVAELAASPDLVLSVNVSPASANDRGWSERLATLLRDHPGTASRLIVEITETTAIADVDEARRFVGRVKDQGARVAIDDFGTGHTSFRHLRSLGADLVKIDGHYIEALAASEDDRFFVRTLLGLARHVGLETVAEHVRDEVSATILAAEGCDYLQGELIGLAGAARSRAD